MGGESMTENIDLAGLDEVVARAENARRNAEALVAESALKKNTQLDHLKLEEPTIAKHHKHVRYKKPHHKVSVAKQSLFANDKEVEKHVEAANVATLSLGSSR